MIRILVLSIGVLFAPQLWASTVSLTEWGTMANIVSGVCAENSCTPEDVVFGELNSEAVDNGFNQTSAATGEVSSTQGGMAQSSAEITGGLDTPILKAKASSADGEWLGVGAFAIQGYEYSGIGETLTFDINFDGKITNPNDNTATGFAVGMYFFSPSQLGLDLLIADPLLGFDLLTTSPEATLGNLALNALLAELASEQVYEMERTLAGDVNEAGQISLTLENGDLFYLAGGVLASAGGEGAIADAFSTLTVKLANPESFAGELNATGTAVVPLPAAAWFFISGLIAVFSIKKRSVI